MPAAATKAATTTRLIRKVIVAVNVAEIGITTLGKISFRSSDSFVTSEHAEAGSRP
jgi:hypothetical protein